MKFNWRANWEILLVLVIIVVGIVITTIAAIRNKDKQLLALQEDNDFGQLLTASNNINGHLPAGSNPTEANGQQHNLFGGSLVNGLHQEDPQAGGSGRRSPPAVHKRPGSSQANQRHSMGNNRAASFNNNRYQKPQEEEAAEYNQKRQQVEDLLLAGPLQQPPGGSSASTDAYDTSSTEVTPSQVRSTAFAGNFPEHYQQQAHQRGFYAGAGKRHAPNRTHSLQPLEGHLDEHGELPSDNFADDIHTTRSSLASPNADAYPATVALASPQSDSMAITHSLALHGPYGVTPSLHGQKGAAGEGPPSPEAEEPLMTSYSRQPAGDSHNKPLASNLTESLLRDFAAGHNKSSGTGSELIGSAMLANLLASMPQATSGDQITPTNEPYSGSLRAHANAPPGISSILGELLRLARPQQLLSALSSPQATGSGPQQHQQQSLMQQLRALPGPIMNLIQGLGPSGPAQSQSDFGGLMNHDASESSQHYHRMSMSPTDIHSILSRSLRSSGALPAFPAPRGSQQGWIPPTSGGNPSYHNELNTNADFVANNAAGFLRSSTRIQQAGTASEQLPAGLQQQEHQQQEPQQQQVLQNQPDSRSWPPAGERHRQQMMGSAQQQNLLALNQQSQQQNQQIVSNFLPPTYNSRPTSGSEMTLPLAFNHQQPPDAGQRNIFEPYSSIIVQGESSPKAMVLAGQQQPPKASLHSSKLPAASSARQAAGSTRKRRSIESKLLADDQQTSAGGSAREEDEEEDGRPISVLRPDGRPLPNGAARVRAGSGRESPDQEQDRQVAQSQQSTRHQSQEEEPAAKQRPLKKPARSKQRRPEKEESRKKPPQQAPPRRPKEGRRAGNLDTAGSGLMSRLLGTASTNDELEDELDEDDEFNAPTSEKKREELEEADFGLNNIEDRLKIGAKQKPKEGKRAETLDQPAEGRRNEESIAPASQRRHQHRSDIDFYGHPGEETRQLKYGILGSGNYEVVNGGIYPEADESTAAVNSVANYVRKPGSLLASLPKLLAEHTQNNNHNDPGSSPADGFMPGGRLVGGGFVRGATNSGEQELIGQLLPASGLGEQPTGNENGSLLASPLLELIDANGSQMIDPNLLLQHLRSSGSSSMSTHISNDQERDSSHEDRGQENRPKRPTSNRHKDRKEKATNGLEGDWAKNEAHRTLSSSSTAKAKASNTNGRNSNQFNSYQILPSKKVTIFSDQDLDSASEEIHFKTIENLRG